MLKIALKEPITSGFLDNGEYYERGMNWLLVQGKVDNELLGKVNPSAVMKDQQWVKFLEPNGNPVLVPLDNIAYIQEQPDNANR